MSLLFFFTSGGNEKKGKSDTKQRQTDQGHNTQVRNKTYTFLFPSGGTRGNVEDEGI